MKRKINIYYLYVSTLLALLSAYIIPCRYISDWRKVFGFPFGWFTVFHDTIGDVIFNSTAVDLLPLFMDIAIYYFIARFIYQRYRSSRKDSMGDVQ